MHKHQDQNRKANCGEQAKTNTKGCDTCPFLPLFPGEQFRQQSAAPGAEHGTDGETDVEERENQGDARNHVGIVGSADKERVGQIVDQDDDLAHHGGNRHGAHRLRDRHRPENFFTAKLSFRQSHRTRPFPTLN